MDNLHVNDMLYKSLIQKWLQGLMNSEQEHAQQHSSKQTILCVHCTVPTTRRNLDLMQTIRF